MILTTTNTIEGHPIKEYKGVVAGEIIYGANIFKDIMAGIHDVIGGRSGSYESVLREARDGAMKEMQREAEKLGANAIIAIDFDYESLGAKQGMMMVSATGTAVVI